MRYPAAEKLEIIRLVEGSHLPVRRTLARIGVPATTFYRWYDRYREHGPEGLEDRSPRPGRVWNRIPDQCASTCCRWRSRSLSCRRGSWPCASPTRRSYFVSEASVYRLLKAHDLITSPAFIVVKAAEAFTDKTTAPNQLWQTDFTYLKVIGWGWFYLSTILDDFSRYIVAWKLCTTMRAGDVTDTLELALRPRAATAPRSSTGPGCSATTARPTSPATSPVARGQGHRPHPRRTEPSPDPGQDRALAPDPEEPRPARELLPAGRARGRRQPPSSTTTTTAATTRASATSPPPTSTSAAARPSSRRRRRSRT